MHIKSSLLIFAMLFFANNFYSQVGIGTTNPSPAAMLEVSSQSNGIGDYKGFMPPRVPNVAARDGIAPGASDYGLMVYVLDNGSGHSCLQLWVGDSWVDVKCNVINTAPVATDVEFSGGLQIGETLTASFTYTDADADPAGAHTYTWYLATDALGTGQTVAQTGTSDTYVSVLADDGKYLAVEVTPVATSGESPGIAVLSDYQGPISDGPPNASDLFISEYVEGSSNNKAIEIANFTGSSKNLDDYRLALYMNGSSTPTPIAFNSNFVLADGEVYVIKHSSASGITADQSYATLEFNGNDPVALQTSGGTNIDVVGAIGSNANFAKDVTLRKKPATGPSTTYDSADYDSYPIDTFNGLGSHTY